MSDLGPTLRSTNFEQNGEICNFEKNAHVQRAKNQTSNVSIKKFDPSNERSWSKFWKNIIIFWKICILSAIMRLRILGPSMRKSKMENELQRSPVLKTSMIYFTFALKRCVSWPRGQCSAISSEESLRAFLFQMNSFLPW